MRGYPPPGHFSQTTAPFDEHQLGMRKIIRTRYLVGFGVAALILILIGAAIMLATQQFRRDNREVSHSYDVISQTQGLSAGALQGIASQRSYLLTGIDGYLQVFTKTRAGVLQDLTQLSALVRDDPAQADRVEQLGVLINKRLDLADQGVRIYQQQGLEAAREFTANNGGLSLMQQVHELTNQAVTEQRVLLARRSEATEQSAWVLLGLGALGLPISLTILAWIYLLLTREVRERSSAELDTAELNEHLADTVQRLERAGSDLREISHYAGMLQGCRNVSEALNATRRTLMTLMPNCAGTIYLLHESQDHAEAQATWGDHITGNKPLLLPDECWALRRHKLHAVDNVQLGTVCGHTTPPADGSIATTACLPLGAQNQSMGFLALSREGSGPIKRLDIAVAAAEQLSLALGNLKLQETLRQQSIRDALTGLYNRRYLEESLPRELARCERRNQPLALLMLDMDHFKVFNDTHGHEGGDTVLATFGRLLQNHCRHEDIPCRYGGEEFMLILPEADLDVARARAEEIRAAVEAMTVDHLHRTIGGVTVSIGVAMFPAHTYDGARLKQMADAALYRAKREGRNRVEVAEVG